LVLIQPRLEVEAARYAAAPTPAVSAAGRV